jgi:hypothetical protein
MVSGHCNCPLIETAFNEISMTLKALRKRIEAKCRGGALVFENSEASGGEAVELLESPGELVTRMEKTLEWMKGAKSGEESGKTMVFENKFGEKKDVLEMVVVGKAFLPKLSEVGGSKKTYVTGDHKEMKEDVANPGNMVAACYGKYDNPDNTQRTLFLVNTDEEMGDFRYMPEGASEVNTILKDFSEVSMRMCVAISYLQNWYGAQGKGSQIPMKEWVQDNWTQVACTSPELCIKSAKDLDLTNPAHLNGVIGCIVTSRSIKAMPVGGFFVQPSNNPGGRVTAKTYGLKSSNRDQLSVERGWEVLGARYLEEWKHACIARGMDVKGADTRPELQQTKEGLPIDSSAMWKFMKEHVDYKYVDRVLRNIDENLEVPVPLGKYTSSCFELLGSDLRSVQVKENEQTTRGLMSDEYYAMLAKDLSSTGGVVVSLLQICPRANNIYANLTGLRILYPSRFIAQLRSSWEIEQNTPKDVSKKIKLWIGTDGIDNQTRVMDLAAGTRGKDDVAILDAVTGRGSSLRATNLSDPTQKRDRSSLEDSSSEDAQPKKKQTLLTDADIQDIYQKADDEF